MIVNLKALNNAELAVLNLLKELKTPLNSSEIRHILKKTVDDDTYRAIPTAVWELLGESKIIQNEKCKLIANGVEKNQDREDLKLAIEKLKDIQFDIKEKNVITIKEKIFEILREIQCQ